MESLCLAVLHLVGDIYGQTMLYYYIAARAVLYDTSSSEEVENSPACQFDTKDSQLPSFPPYPSPGPFWCSYSYPQFFPYLFVQFSQLSSYSGDWFSLRFVILCFQCGKHPVRCNWFKIAAVLYFFPILFYFPLTYISGAP